MIEPERAYVFDADGVLWNNEHRLPLIQNNPTDGDWEMYYSDEAILADPEIPGGVALARQLMQLGRLVIVTGRRESCRGVTIQRLHDAQLYAPDREPYVIMRDNNDRRPNHEFKQDAAWTLRPPWWDIQLWVDDNAQVADALQHHGIPVLITAGIGQFITEGT